MVLLTMVEVIPFTLYLFLWVALFALSYIALGMTIEDDTASPDELEYPYMNFLAKFIVQSYRNTIGDIATPHYEVWYP